MSNGLFAPGITDEPGTTDEIEFTVDLAGGPADVLAVLGQQTADLITTGTGGSTSTMATTWT
jgi:hypothetical protein